MTPILSFLQDGHLPQDPGEARKIRKRAARFTILNNILYKRGFSMPYLKCVDADEAKYILEEIHGGNLWKPCWPQIPCKQGYKDRLFLAYYAGGRIGARQEVREVPTIRERPETASRKDDDDNLPMVVCTMGN